MTGLARNRTRTIRMDGFHRGDLVPGVVAVGVFAGRGIRRTRGWTA